MPERFIIFCDESVEKGPYYSHFYGGALVRANDRLRLENAIAEKKRELGFNGEVKWTKITENYADKYISLVDFIFDEVEKGSIKFRIMFLQNIYRPPTLDEYRMDNQYFLLYYQFIKHAFGLRYWRQEDNHETAEVSVYIDDPPQTRAKFNTFADYISSLSKFPPFSQGGVSLPRSEIAKVRSHDHNIMQALDIVLGGIQSRLNESHTKPVPPAQRLSKRARARARVYARIKDRIWKIYPRFNVGVSTATPNLVERWTYPYCHWLFVPGGSEVDRSRGKNK